MAGNQANDGGEPSKVRRSIGEWEASGKQKQGQSPTAAPPPAKEALEAPGKDLLRLTSPQGQRVAQVKVGEAKTSPITCIKTAEARRLMEKAKNQLDLSGNIKKEMKASVKEIIEKLYKMVKDLELEKKRLEMPRLSSATTPKLTNTANTTFTVTPEPDQCFPKNILTKLEEQTKLIEENGKKMDELRASMETQKETLGRMATTATYASVAAASPNSAPGAGPTLRRGTLHSVVVTSKDETETGDEVLDKIRKAVDAKDGWITVERVKKAKDRKVVMGLATREEREKIKDRLAKEVTNLIVEDVKNKDPLLILRSVLSINTDEDVLKALRNQNRDIFRDLGEEEDRVSIKYRKRARNPHTGHIVISVSPIIYQRAINRGNVHIDLQRIKVEDQSPLVQCTRCLGFGHGKRFCTEQTDLCGHCGGPHLKTECEEWLAKIPPRCHNCFEQQWLTTAEGTKKVQTPYRVAQANLQRKKLATDELLVEAERRKIALALLQEPYVGASKEMRSHRGVRIYQSDGTEEGVVKAAIAIFDDDLNVEQYPKLTTNNIVVVGISTVAWRITLVSIYFEPDQPIEPYLEHLSKIRKEIDSNKWIIGGDANAKSVWWGSPQTDHRGEDLMGTLNELNLNVLNMGNIPTFDTVRGDRRFSSFVDITACSTEMLDLVDDWKVDEGLTSSDHNGILFKIQLKKSTGIKIQRTTRLYNTKKANWTDFHEKLGQLLQENHLTKPEIEQIETKEKIEEIVNKLTQVITEICKKSIPKKKNKENLKLPWWSPELEEMKQIVTTRKRRIRCAAPVRRERVVKEYLEAKEQYESRAVKAQVESWKDFCKKQDKEGLWEGIYRVIGRVTKRVEDVPLEKNGETLSAKESVKLLAETFYPEDSASSDDAHHRQTRKRAAEVNDGEQNETCEPPFTMAELIWSCESFNPKKAPGAEGFTADICCHAIRVNPELFLTLLNKCLKYRYFPKIWKEATVVVLRKPGKDNYANPKSYRPIGLLPIFGKILEKMLVARLKSHLIPRTSACQYGFMPQRSTEDSLYTLMQRINKKLGEKRIVTLISLDIEGAFDSAWWPAIRVRLAEENCPVGLRQMMDSYLKDRSVTVRYAGEQYGLETSKGCVQGSIAGPILWNLLLDPLLKSLQARGDYCQAFADDVALVVDGSTAMEIEAKANSALEHAREWGVRNKLKFAPHKTNAMLITRKLKYDTPRLCMGGINIGMVKEIKMLGVVIDNKLTFNEHVSNVCKKAVGIHKQLSRAAKASWGLHPEVIKTIYVATVEPIVLYAASVWAPAATKISVQKQLAAVQRGIAQKLCKAYRTVSLNSALILAGILPLDLRVREAASLYEAKRGVPQPGLGDWEVERMAPAAEMPHPAERQELKLISLVDQNDVNNHSNYEVRIYTDGSKIGGGVGASLSIWRGEAEIKARKLALPKFCTVYQAELLAICVATREVKNSKANTFGIYSDSMAALQTIQNYSCLHPLAVEARDNIRTISHQGKIIALHWIKAHAGLEGNERADELAKGAAADSKRKRDYDQCPVSFVKRNIRMATLDKWNWRYTTGETASITKLFFPDAVAAYGTVRKIEFTSPVTQLMTGHGGFSEYLHRFKCKENPSCICEPGRPESIPHLIAECPQFSIQRHDTENKIGEEIKVENISKIMQNKYIRDTFLEYCKKIVKIVINRNK
ncbi:uncharacterized protein LOC134665540 [Cydia fagiglandana]|uniref:uncharacterized protein LOC134665540 n=1 Tax=Cydia fagiglandana TaxID=1458189 RepID=UPI002FEE5C14